MTTKFFSQVRLGIHNKRFKTSKNTTMLIQRDTFWRISWFFFQDVKAIQNEISVLKNVKHERIVSYYGSEQRDGYLHVFMDFMPGVRAFMWCCPLAPIDTQRLFQIASSTLGLVLLKQSQKKKWLGNNEFKFYKPCSILSTNKKTFFKEIRNLSHRLLLVASPSTPSKSAGDNLGCRKILDVGSPTLRTGWPRGVRFFLCRLLPRHAPARDKGRQI